MSERDDIQREVRQRERFMCALGHDTDVGMKQYAHVVPESAGGPYEVNNLVWLCEGCQRKYEPANKKDELRELLIKRMEEIRDAPRFDNLATGVFDELLLHPERPVVVRMGSDVYQDVQRPFTEQAPNGETDIQYLEFRRDGLSIVLNGMIKDEHGLPLITFEDSKLRFHTFDAWDFERKPRFLKIINNTQQVWFSIEQADDMSVRIEGELYFDHVKLTLDQAAAKVSYGGITMIGNRMTGGFAGLALPYTRWYPVRWAKDW